VCIGCQDNLNAALIAFNWPFFMMIQASGFSWCIMGNWCPSIRFIFLQTTQHDDVLGGNVDIVHVGYQPPPPYAMSSL
jgi:hypothetical protein